MSVYTDLLLQGAPSENPITDDELKANDDWLKKLDQAKFDDGQEQAAAAKAAKGAALGILPPTAAATGTSATANADPSVLKPVQPQMDVGPIGIPQFDKMRNSLVDAGLVSDTPKLTLSTSPGVIKTTNTAGAPVLKLPADVRAPDLNPPQGGGQVEKDPVKAQILDGELAGFDPAVRGRLLNVYSDAMATTGGDSQEAHRKLLMNARDALAGPDEMGWAEYPKGEPNDVFWKKYLSGYDNANRQGFKEQYNILRTQGIQGLYGVSNPNAPGAGTDFITQWKQNLDTMGLSDKGPLDAFDSMAAMQEWERLRYPNGRPPSEVTLGDVVLNSLVAGPFGPLAVAGAAGAQIADLNLPESTPQVARTAIEFGLYGLGGEGTLLARGIQAAKFGVASAVGQQVSELTGTPNIIGTTLAPVLAPGTAGLLARQFGFTTKSIVANAEGVADHAVIDAAVKKLPVDLGKSDLGARVVVGDNVGTVSAMPSKNVYTITLEDGRQIHARPDDIALLPLAGKGGTVASTAAGEATATPLVLTPETLSEMPVRPTRLHYTDPANSTSILSGGFKPSPASRESLPGVYVTADEAPIAEARAGNRAAVIVQPPPGPVASAQLVADVRKLKGFAQDAEGQTKLAAELQKQGFVGAEGRPGVEVYFDPKAVKATVAVQPGGTFEDFMGLAKGIMRGETKLMMVPSIAGGGTISGLSLRTNTIIQGAFGTVDDYSMARISLSSGAVAKQVPNTALGRGYQMARSIVSMNPGLRRLVQPMFYHTANYAEADQMLLTSRIYALQKATEEAFGKQFIDDAAAPHMADRYVGPSVPVPGQPGVTMNQISRTSAASDYVRGTLADVIDHPEEYALTATQRQVVELFNFAKGVDEAVTASLGVSEPLMAREHIPYKRETDPSGWLQSVVNGIKKPSRELGNMLEGVYSNSQAGGTLREWADTLAQHGATVETDVWKNLNARMQGLSKLRSDQIFLKSSVAAYGRPIVLPQAQQVLREDLSRMRKSVNGRLKLATGLAGRSVGEVEAVQNLQGHLDGLNRELDAIGDKFAGGFGGKALTGTEFDTLEGRLGAFEEETRKISDYVGDFNDRWMETQLHLHDIRDQVQQLQREIYTHKLMLKNATPAPGWIEVGPGRFGNGERWAVPETVANEMRNATQPKELSEVSNFVRKAQEFTRSFLLSNDASFATQQGYADFVMDPARFLSEMGTMALITATREGYLQYMTQNLDSFTKFAQAGGTIYTTATDIIKGAGTAKSLVDRVPITSQVNEMAYGRWLPTLKMRQAQTLVHMLDNIAQDKTLLQRVFSVTPFVGENANKVLRQWAGVEGKSGQQLMEAAAETMNNIGGGINWAKLMTQPNLASGMVFLTEGWMRANMGRIVNLARIGSPEGVLARRWMFQNLAMAASISTFFSMALSGRMPSFDPTSTDFLDIRVGKDTDLNGGSIPFLPGKTYIRTAMQAIAGTPWESQSQGQTSASGAPTGSFAGMLTPGNIDLAKRPTVRNKDGSISTVRSISIEEDGQEVLIPTVSDDGRVLSNADAIAFYRQTGKFLGKFDNAKNADTYAAALHTAQNDKYGQPSSGFFDRLLSQNASAESRVASVFRFGEGRVGQWLRIGIDEYTGKDYLGRPIDNRLTYFAKSLAPVSAQQYLEAKDGMGGHVTSSTALGVFGLNWIPNSPQQVRDAKIAEAGIVDRVTKQPLTSYDQLGDIPKRAFDEAHPEYTAAVHQWQQDRNSPYVALRAVTDEHREAIAVLGKAFMGQPITDEERALLGDQGSNVEQVKGDTRIYRQFLAGLTDKYKTMSDQLGKQEDFAPNSAETEVVSGYYSEVVEKSKVSGTLDFGKMDRNLAAYRRFVSDKYGPAGLDTLDAELLFRTTDDPVAQAYHKDSQLWAPYFDYTDSFFKASNLTQVGFTPAQAAEAAKFPNQDQYESWLTEAYHTQLTGKPLPSEIYDRKTSPGEKSLGEKWGVIRGKPLTDVTARDIAEEFVRIKFKEYDASVARASDKYLIAHRDALCAGSYWNVIEPTESTRPYLDLCPAPSTTR